MATPKDTRSYHLPISDTDALHVYSSEKGIWIQLRRLIPTENDITDPSFKVGMELSPEMALLLSKELEKVALSPGPKKKKTTQSKSQKGLKLGLCTDCKEHQLIEHQGRGWCPLCGKFDRQKKDAILPPAPEKPKKPKVYDFTGGSK